MARNLLRMLAGPVGGAIARAALRGLAGHPALQRTNFRGRTVSLAGGPALALGATAGAMIGAASGRGVRPQRQRTGGQGSNGSVAAALAVGGSAVGEEAMPPVAGRAATALAAGKGAAGRREARRAAARLRKTATERAGAGSAGERPGAGGSVSAGPVVASGAVKRPGAGVSVRRAGAGNVGTGRVVAATAVAGLGAGAVGLFDDLVGGRPEHAAKGFRGHLGALREGRVTSGLVKVAGVGAAGLVAAALLPRRRTIDVLLGAGVIAGAANLFNLLDLRPGRAIKAGMIVGAPMGGSAVAAGALGAAGALLPADLDEEIMLGDAGANALGALLGTAFTARAGTFGRAAALAGIVALTAASEKVSFTKVIEGNPLLHHIDQLGRRPAPATTGAASSGGTVEEGVVAGSEAVEDAAAAGDGGVARAGAVGERPADEVAARRGRALDEGATKGSRQEGLRQESPRQESPRQESPRGEGPRGEGPRGEGPRGEGAGNSKAVVEGAVDGRRGPSPYQLG